jgi:cell shape-determining protein MreC
MEEFKADILSTNKKGRLYFYLVVALACLVIVLLIYLQIVPVFLQIFSVLFWLFAILKYVLQTKKQVLKKSIGALKISEDQISIFHNKFSLADVKSLKVSVSGWRSYKRANDRSQPVSDIYNEDNNT